jgi:two-component system NtrC family sensor kinase
LTVGRELVELVAEADRPPLQSALDATLAGRSSRVEVAFQRDDEGLASRRIVAVAMSRLPEADPPALLLVARDVTTEREMRTRLMEADRLAAVGELVAGVAHEVNNPLSTISAFSQLMLRDEGLSESQREGLDVIKSETIRASQVVKDLLSFSRRSAPHRELVDVNDVIERTLRLRGYQMKSSCVTVETELCPELPNVAGDARQLQQVFLNLVVNAVQAMTPMGGGTLRLMTRDDAGRVVMDVRDTGPGIPAWAKARIFEPFVMTKDEGEGTGLGLSVSYGIIAAHGGTIEAIDSSSEGTTMRVTLPSSDSI